MSLIKTVKLCEDSEVCFGNHENGNKSNIGYINSDRVYVFDSCYSPVFFYEYISKLSHFRKKIVVVLSHHHEDHIKGISEFEKNENVSVICTSSTADVLKTNINNITICKEDICLNRHIFVRRFVNCHTDEDLILEDLDNKILFLGDILLDGHHPHINNVNVRNWIKCLELFRDKKLNYYIPGHGENMSRLVIDHYIGYLNQMLLITKKSDFEKNYNQYVEEFSIQSRSLSWKQVENVRGNFEFLQKNMNKERLN